MHELSSTRHPYQDTSLATPHFNHNNSKESKTFHQPPSNPIEKTHKKSAYSSHPQDNQVACISFEQNDYLKIQHEKVLKQLSDSEQKLIKSERGYADLWRKYEIAGHNLAQAQCRTRNPHLRTVFVKILYEIVNKGFRTCSVRTRNICSSC